MESSQILSHAEKVELAKTHKKTRNPVKKRRQKKRLRKGYGARRHIHMNDPEATLADAAEQRIRYPDNYISTTKYTVYNFFFKNLWEQFHRIANIYFVGLGIITLTPASPVSPGPYIAVIILVLGVVMFKDCWEDWQRYLSDREVNSRPCHVLRGGTWQDVPWDHVVVGDVLRVLRDEQFPADLLLLSTDKANGQCHVQTANLDGEINLKVKEALPLTAGAVEPAALGALRLMFDCGQPSASLKNFNCSTHVDGAVVGLSMEQLLVRSTVLKNSEFANGLVVYTGHQTKYMQNCIDPPHKMSNLERKVNWYIIYILLGLVALCAISAGLGVWYQQDVFRDSWYISRDLESSDFVWFILLFFSFLVVYGDVVPISLYVTMEMVRLMAGRFIEVDLHLYDPVTRTRMRCLTTTLNEELGQIEYLFSDKTGTLTANKMTLNAVFADGHTYGHVGILQSKQAFADPDLFQRLQANHTEHSAQLTPVIDFFVALALCNTVFPAHSSSDPDQVNMESESPDELALVLGASEAGVKLKGKESGHITVSVLGDDLVFQLLHILPFDADRKRMSCLLRYPDGSIRVLIKGADSAMLPLASSDDETPLEPLANAISEFARSGLRVLVVGQRVIGDEAYQEWLETCWQPMLDSFGEEKLDRIATAIRAIEQDISMLGVTGIEDELQAEVPETITSLLLAGIKVWMLTGDKLETAENVARSCALIKPNDQILLLTANGSDNVEALAGQLSQHLLSLSDSTDSVLIINGEDIDLVLHHPPNRVAFLEVAQQCTSVVVSRATPAHKRLMVELVKEHLGPITAAIGDGANDVPMIQEAHIGIGISGEEGTQAANNADYSIAQFRFLTRLLLVHGRWSYKRMCLLILYFFYKNIVISIIPLWFAIDNGFTGSAFFDALTRRGYNVIFTAFPIIVMAVLDQDVFAPGCLRFPQLYIDCQRNSSLNKFAFFKWCFWGLYDAVIIYYFARYSVFGTNSVYSSEGFAGGLELLSTTCYTSMILVANLRLAFHCRYWTIFHVIAFLLSVLLWYFLAWILTQSFDINPNLFGVVDQLFAAASFWWVTILSAITCMLPDVILRAVRREFFPMPFHIIQEATKKKVEADLRDSNDSTVCLEPGDWCLRWCRTHCPRSC